MPVKMTEVNKVKHITQLAQTRPEYLCNGNGKTHGKDGVMMTLIVMMIVIVLIVVTVNDGWFAGSGDDNGGYGD